MKHHGTAPFWCLREEVLKELLAPERVMAEGLFQVDTIERLKREHLAGSANHSHILWSLIVFQDWRGRWQV